MLVGVLVFKFLKLYLIFLKTDHVIITNVDATLNDQNNVMTPQNRMAASYRVYNLIQFIIFKDLVLLNVLIFF